MMTLQTVLREYLQATGESMRGLSLRAGLNEKAVADILNVRGLRPTAKTITALSDATGIDLLSENSKSSPETFADLIARVASDNVAFPRGRTQSLRLRWLMKEAGWIPELKVVNLAEVREFFATASPISLGITKGSFATYKSDIMSILNETKARARKSDVRDVTGVWAELKKAITSSDFPADYKRISGSILSYLAARQIMPSDLTAAVMREYFQDRLTHADGDERKATKHLRKVAGLIARLSTDPAFASFKITNPGHGLPDRRDKFAVDPERLHPLLTEFDERVLPWARGEKSAEGRSRKDFLALLDDELRSVDREGKKAKLPLRRSISEQAKSREALLHANGFLTPNMTWSDRTASTRRAQIVAAAKALLARNDICLETMSELTDPDFAEVFCDALSDANMDKEQSGYIESVMATVIKIAAGYVRRPEQDIAALRALKERHAVTRRTIAPRNRRKLASVTRERTSGFLHVADELIRQVNARSNGGRSGQGQKSAQKLDIEQCRDVMCAVAQEVMLARAPRKANVLRGELSWIRWNGDTARIVVPSEEVKMRGLDDPDLTVLLSPYASGLLRVYLVKVRPHCLAVGDAANPYIFPGQGKEIGSYYKGLLLRLCRRVKEITGLNINPHLYRHLVGWIWLREDPGALPQVSKMLGHSQIKTTVEFYAALDEEQVFEKWSKLIDDLRKQPRNPGQFGSRSNHGRTALSA